MEGGIHHEGGEMDSMGPFIIKIRGLNCVLAQFMLNINVILLYVPSLICHVNVYVTVDYLSEM